MLYYKIDVMKALKIKGYNTNVIRKNKLIGESSLTKIRNNQYVKFEVLNTLCDLLHLQPGDIIGFMPDDVSKVIKETE